MARGGSAKVKASTPRVSVEVEPNVRETSAAAEWVHVSAWAPHAKNPRVHREEVLNLARTIIRTAWGAPVVAQWRASGKHRGIAGHGRILALTEILAGVESTASSAVVLTSCSTARPVPASCPCASCE